MHSISDYYSAVQLRADRWSELRETVDRLTRQQDDSAESPRLIRQAEALFEALGPIEMYWAFPGMAAFDHLRRQLQHHNWDDLAFSIRRTVRALTSGAYRRRTIPLARGEAEGDEIEDEASLPLEARALSRPYFEVLIVDELTEHQERWLKASLGRMRRSEDAFVYEPVVVPSLEDALIAILFNPNIQAIEVRLTALSGDVRKFRPYRTVSGQWLDFTRVPSMSPKLVLNQPAADAFEEYHVPAEMRVGGASANVTPQFVGVVDDGDIQPRAYVRLDELTTWLPPSRMADPNTGGEMRLLMTQGEGGSVGWHWCMSNLPGNDEFLRLAAKLEKTVVEDEIYHGPEEIKELAASFDPAQSLPWDETLNLAREMRYLDVRERNEQFMYPLGEAELEDIRRGIFEDTLAPSNIYAAVA